MKNLVIIGLLGYIIWDRYVKEDNMAQLKTDVDNMKAKVDEIVKTIKS